MTDTTVEAESETEVKKPVKEIPVVQDQGYFQHDTGDTYEGFFEAKKKDRSVKMHDSNMESNEAALNGLVFYRVKFNGPITDPSQPINVDRYALITRNAAFEWILYFNGKKSFVVELGKYWNKEHKSPGTYTTAEGDIYVGTWESDRLGANEDVTVTFTDGSRYEGMFKDWSYSGRGQYFYPDGSILRGDFLDSSPTGNLILLDPNDHKWLGKAEQGYGWFEPINHFYEMLEKTRESRVKRRHKIKYPNDINQPQV